MAAAISAPMVQPNGPPTPAAAANASPTAATATALPAGQFANMSLYVGDLDLSVNEGQLFDLFSQVASVVSIRVCRDQTRRCSLGYGYVNFANAQEGSYTIYIYIYTFIH